MYLYKVFFDWRDMQDDAKAHRTVSLRCFCLSSNPPTTQPHAPLLPRMPPDVWPVSAIVTTAPTETPVLRELVKPPRRPRGWTADHPPDVCGRLPGISEGHDSLSMKTVGKHPVVGLPSGLAKVEKDRHTRERDSDHGGDWPDTRKHPW